MADGKRTCSLAMRSCEQKAFIFLMHLNLVGNGTMPSSEQKPFIFFMYLNLVGNGTCPFRKWNLSCNMILG